MKVDKVVVNNILLDFKFDFLLNQCGCYKLETFLFNVQPCVAIGMNKAELM